MTVTNNAQVRALDPVYSDWTFGQGASNFYQNQNAVAQNIQTRLNLLLGECFFSINQGVDWLNYLSSKNQLALNLAISSTILGTANVVGLKQISAALNPISREYIVSYDVQTTYSTETISDVFVYSLNGTT